MSSKKRLSLFILFTFAATISIQAEIINISKLEQVEKTRGKKEFSVYRDIFSPFKKVIEQNQGGAVPPQRIPERIEKSPEEENRVKERDVAAEVRQRIIYEGYVIRGDRRLALLTIDNEFFVVNLGDTVKETIKIVNIGKESLTVEVNANLIEINIKEDQNNEIQ